MLVQIFGRFFVGVGPAVCGRGKGQEAAGQSWPCDFGMMRKYSGKGIRIMQAVPLTRAHRGLVIFVVVVGSFGEGGGGLFGWGRTPERVFVHVLGQQGVIGADA